MNRPDSQPTISDSRQSPPKVAIVCDWLTGTGGAERVVLELHRMFPEAPIYTSQYDKNSKIWYDGQWFQDADVRTTWLQKLPKSMRKFLPLFRAWSFSRLNLSEYDVVISSSGAEAKAVKTGPETLHICYCHSPTHYYWSRYDEYIKRPGFGSLDWLARLGLRILAGPLRRWDKHAAKRPDIMVANSTHTQTMIKKYYKRDSVVVYPPVDTDHFKPTGTAEPRHGFVTAGRQTPYKRIDLAVAACSELKVPLIVIGNGPEHKKLEKLAGRSVTFLTNVTDEDMVRHFQTAQAFIFPTNVEDFGVTAVEALAAGTPVIALGKGGPLDYVIPGKTGLLYEKQTVQSLVKTLQGFNPERFDAAKVAQETKRFSVAAFHTNIEKLVTKSLANFGKLA